MRSIVLGFHYFINGFSLLTKPGIKRFVIVPLIINVLLFIGLFFFLNHYVAILNIWFKAHIPSWLAWLSHILWILFFLSFSFFIIYAFMTVSNLLLAPFNSLLSEKIAWYLTGKVSPSRTIWENIKDIPRIIGRQLLVLFYYLPRLLLLFILFFIPVVQLIAPILWFLFHAFYMTMTFMDYPTDNQRVSFKAMQAWLRKNRLLALSVGSCILVASMVPIVNFFAIAAAVASATQIWVEKSGQ